MVKEGNKAPDFCLSGLDEKGEKKEISLKDFKGKKVFLCFYPKDDTPGCTQEACDFRDNIKALTKKGVAVVGATPDSVASHEKIRDKQGLNFALLSDPEKNLAENFGAYGEKKNYGKVTRGIIQVNFSH